MKAKNLPMKMINIYCREEKMEKNLLFQALVIAGGLFASAFTASISYFFTKKHQLKMEERRLKEEFYKNFIKALSDVAIDNKNDDAQKRLSECFNTSLLIADANVVAKMMGFHDLIRMENISRNPDEWLTKHDELLTDLIIAMRKDLMGKEKIATVLFPKVHLVGKKPSDILSGK